VAVRPSKKKEQPLIPLVADKTPLLVEHKEQPKKQRFSLAIPGFQSLSALMKLRVIITALVVMLTIAMVLIFANGYMISAALLLLSYIVLIILMLKLFQIKKL
jgi:hypothetical protein